MKQFWKKNWRKFVVLVLAVSLTFGSAASKDVLTVQADSISDAKKKVEDLKKKKLQLEADLQDLKTSKADILDYIEQLDSKMNALEDEMTDTNNDIDTTNDNLTQTKADLETAREKEAEQYSNMKTRIQYMYENGGEDYVDILLSAGSLSDLLNRSEYIEKISEYDNTMLDRFIAAKEAVQEQETKLEQQLSDLNDYKESLQVEEESVKEVQAAKQEQLEKYNAQIATAKANVSDYESEIDKQEQVVENLLEEQRKEAERKAAAEAAAKKNHTSTGSSDFNPSASSSGFRWPLGTSGTITCGFGSRSAPTAGASTYHEGIDIGVAYGTPILAAQSGTVTTASYSGGCGNYVMIYHGNSTFTIYMHASRLAVSKGDFVSKGQVIAYVGSTGISTGNHLHFGISINGSYVNPLNYVSR